MTTFVDGSTIITADWLNQVDTTINNGVSHLNVSRQLALTGLATGSIMTDWSSNVSIPLDMPATAGGSLTGAEQFSIKSGGNFYTTTPVQIKAYSLTGIDTTIRGTTLTGFSTGTNSAVVATDTVLAGFGKLQTQISSAVNPLPTQTGHTGALVTNGTTASWLDSPTSLRNKLINATFNINQRGVSGTVTLAAGAYGHDRWKAGASGCTYTFSNTANVTTITITAGTLMQVIEGLNLRSGTYTLTWVGTSTARIDSGSYGTSGITGTAVGGTNQTIELSTGTFSSPQYEFGTVATPFEFRSINTELYMCQRYYVRAGSAGNAYAISSSNLGLTVQFPVDMRATPTLITISGSGNNAIIRIGGTAETITTFTSYAAINVRGFYFYGAGTGYTVGGYHVVNNLLECSAEL